MTNLQKALYTTWLSRLGRSKVKDLAGDLEAGSSVAERSRALVAGNTPEELNRMLLDGFGGFFHQGVYLRRPTDPAATSASLQGIPPGGDPINSVSMKMSSETVRGETRCLLMVERDMEFVPLNPGPIISAPIEFPVAVTATDQLLVIQVLTMESTADKWGEIIGEDVRKMLTTVQQDSLHDQTLNFLQGSGVDTGGYVDYSDAAKRLIRRADINTFAGTLEVGTVGSTKHNTVRGRGRRALRESMPEEFQKLILARRIMHVEVELADDYAGLSAQAKIVLYPTVGKMTFRSNLGGSDPDEFIKTIAG